MTNLRTNSHQTLNTPEKMFIDTTINHDSKPKVANREDTRIAVISVACRLPGSISSLAEFRDALFTGRKVLGRLPEDLFLRNKMNLTDVTGGLIDDIFKFDAQLFGISPREAQAMEPQQRLALSLSWELFENAGITRAEINNSATGVFMGISDNSYFELVRNSIARDDAVYLPTGNALNAIAGRINHYFGLNGPSMAVDTACSSSLVALDLAVQALQAGRCEKAIVGGLNIMLDATRNFTLLDIGMLSPSGMCSVFDECANGYVRSEAAAMVLLKPLDAALRDGDRVMAVIEGTACNHNGGGAGLTVPKIQAQQDVIRAALAQAGRNIGDVDWVEAHGTGTRLGDPIEFEALDRVFKNENRQDKSAPIWISSLKSQFGHSESAAGMLSLLKSIVVFEAGVLPAQFGLNKINPEITALQSQLKIPRKPVNLPKLNTAAVINGFGFSGTNASVVITPGTGKCVETTYKDIDSLGLFCVTGHTSKAFTNNANALAAYLQGMPNTPPLSAIETLLNADRTPQKFRKAIVAASCNELIDELLECIKAVATYAPKHERLVFSFPGQGTLYPGMGRLLFHQLPLFASELTAIAARLAPLLDLGDAQGFLDMMWQTEEPTRMTLSTTLSQSALFSIGYALGCMLLKLGIKPELMIGQSLGELTACAVAGVWSIEDACQLVVARGKLMQDQHGVGGMVSLRCNSSEVEELLTKHQLCLSIAGFNEPNQTVVSGENTTLEKLMEILVEATIPAIRLQVPCAFHSPAMSLAAQSFAEIVARVPAQKPKWPILSTLTGNLESEAFIHADYWHDQMIQGVNIVKAAKALAQIGEPICCVEMGCNNTLISHLSRSLGKKSKHRFLYWERAKEDHPRQIASTLGGIYESGAAISFRLLYPQAVQARAIYTLPLTKFDLTPCLPKYSLFANRREIPNELLTYVRLPGSKVDLAQHRLSLITHDYLRHHIVYGKLLVPGAMHCLYALEASAKLYGMQSVSAIGSVQFTEAAICNESTEKILQAYFERTENGIEFSTRSFVDSKDGPQEIIQHSTGRLLEQVSLEHGFERIARSKAATASTGQFINGETFYERFRTLADLDLGPSFRWLKHITVAGQYAVAHLERHPESGNSPLAVDPGLLDSCFQAIGAVPYFGLSTPKTVVPFSVSSVILLKPLNGSSFTCHIQVDPSCNNYLEEVTGHATLVDVQGQIVLMVEGLTLRKISRLRLLREECQEDPVTMLYAYTYSPAGAIGRFPPMFSDFRVPTLPHHISLANQYQAVLETVAHAYAVQIAHDASNTATTIPANQTHLWSRICAANKTAETGIWHCQKANSMLQAANLEQVSVLFDNLIRQWPGLKPELNLLRLCVPRVKDILFGFSKGVDVLFPEGDSSYVSSVYKSSELAQVVNTNFANNILKSARQRNTERPLRILEIGGGTGATTQHVLEALAGIDIHYTFTDISPTFVRDAEARFGEQILHYTLIDIEDDPVRQGLDASGYDIILCANVLHATCNLNASLLNINRVAAFGADLILLEGNGRQMWLDLTFGLTDGWWHFNDSRTITNYPLWDEAEWQDGLMNAGFEMTAIKPEEVGLPQQVYVAHKIRASSRESECCAVVGADSSLVNLLASQLSAGGIGEVLAYENQVTPDEVCAQFLTKQRSDLRLVWLDSGTTVHFDPASSGSGWLDQSEAVLSAIKLASTVIEKTVCSFDYVRLHQTGESVTTASFENAALKTLGMESQIGTIRYIQVDDLASGAQEILSDTKAPCILIEKGQRQIRQIAKYAVPAQDSPGVLQTNSDSHIITGGNSGLATPLVQWLVGQGARRIDLLLRGTAAPHTLRWMELAYNAGCNVVVHDCDLRDLDKVSTSVASMREDGVGTACIYHLAGILDNRLIKEQDRNSLASTINTKVGGLVNLIGAFGMENVPRMVLYSSAAAVIGSQGQLNHSLANAALDQIAAELVAKDCNVLSIGWGPWSEIGVASKGEMVARMEALGIAPFSRDLGRTICAYLMENMAKGHVVPLQVDWSHFADITGDIFVNRETQALRGGLIRHTSKQDITDLPFSSAAGLIALGPEIRITEMCRILCQLMEVALNLPRDTINSNDMIHDVGVDSLIAIEIRTRLNKIYGIELPIKLFLENITITNIAHSVIEQLQSVTRTPMPALIEGEI